MEVKGLDSIQWSIIPIRRFMDHNPVCFGDNIVVFWRVDKLYAKSTEIWCGEISLERREMRFGARLSGRMLSSHLIIMAVRFYILFLSISKLNNKLYFSYEAFCFGGYKSIEKNAVILTLRKLSIYNLWIL